jgi:hypothetical protein
MAAGNYVTLDDWRVGFGDARLFFYGRSIPYYAAAIVTAIAPTTIGACQLLKTCRQRQRLRAGLCLTCGYDLRATPDRCPECGEVPEKRG